MALSKTYMDMPENAPDNFQGYVQNGKFTTYKNWPPLPFIVLANWFKLTGQSDIYAARLFYTLLYAINALLFLVFLRQSQVGIKTSIISTIGFILLPSHLDFASVIYVDQWQVTFWLLALIIYNSKLLIRTLLFYSTILLGSFFTWFTIFLLPTPVILYLTKRHKTNLKQVLGIISISIVVLWTLQHLLFTAFSEAYAIKKISAYSIFGIVDSPQVFGKWFLKRIVSMGYEVLVIFPLLILLGRKNWKSTLVSTKPVLLNSLLLLSIALFLYTVCFTNWFGMHRHGLGMFSILIGGIIAMLLSQLENESVRKFKLGSILTITIPCILFLLLPHFTKIASEVKEQDAQVANFINQRRTSPSKKTCLFFDSPNIAAKDFFKFYMGQFAIKEYTNAYTFNLHEMHEQVNIEENIIYGISRLESNRIPDYDPNSAFLVSIKNQRFDNIEVLDSIIVNGYHVYQLRIKK